MSLQEPKLTKDAELRISFFGYSYQEMINKLTFHPLKGRLTTFCNYYLEGTIFFYTVHSS